MLCYIKKNAQRDKPFTLNKHTWEGVKRGADLFREEDSLAAEDLREFAKITIGCHHRNADPRLTRNASIPQRIAIRIADMEKNRLSRSSDPISVNDPPEFPGIVIIW